MARSDKPTLVTMETSPEDSKHRRGISQSGSPVREEAGFTDAFCSTSPNRTWRPEPNFNINFRLISPRNPRPTTESSKPHGGNKKDPGNKGGGRPGAKAPAAAGETPGKSTSHQSTPGERDDPPRYRSRIPALSRSSERLKSPNPKHTPTFIHSPKAAERTKAPVSRGESAGFTNPKPHDFLGTEPTTKTVMKSPKMQTNRKEGCGKESGLDAPSLKTLHLPLSPRTQNPTGDSNLISPTLSNRNPAMATKAQKPEQTRHLSTTHGSETPPVGSKLQNQRSETALLTTKAPRSSSLSPKPSIERKVSGPKNCQASGSKETLDSKDLSAGSKSSSSATKDSLDSKMGSRSKSRPNSEATVGSEDSLDSKNGSASRTSWESNDSLESKVSPNCESGIGSGDSLDSKGAAEIRVSQSSPDLQKPVGSGVESNPHLDPKPQTPLDSKASPGLYPDPLHFPTETLLVVSGLQTSLGGSSLRTGPINDILKTTISSAKPCPDHKTGPDSSPAAPVQSGAKSALADLSPSLTPASGPGSESSSPGPGPAKILGGCGSAAPNSGGQRSPISAPGSALLAPLATSSPKTRTTVAPTKSADSRPEPAGAGSVTEEMNQSGTSHNFSFTRGLTFDSITKTTVKAEDERLKLPETKMAAVPAPPQGPERRVDVTDKAGWSPGARSGLHGATNAISDGGSIHKLKETNISPCSKTVRDSATMTDPSDGLPPWGVERREVGVQVQVEVTAASSSSVHKEPPASSSPIGSPSGPSGSQALPTVPSLCCVPAGQTPFQHICKIDIELRSQSMPPSVRTDKASSLPACLRTYSFQQTPALMSERQLGSSRCVSVGSICEDETEEEVKGDDKATEEKRGEEEEEEEEDTAKPQEVAWDKQGMTWEVYGASVDLECLGSAIQSHLETKIQEQQKHITTLRKSICSTSSAGGCKTKKSRKRRGGILGCCRKAPAVAD
ncbi:uncharacterized protein V6R79_004631 [Siganus canaliculatus]